MINFSVTDISASRCLGKLYNNAASLILVGFCDGKCIYMETSGCGSASISVSDYIKCYSRVGHYID